MKIKYYFSNPLQMSILTICCLWIVTDMAYGVRFWELETQAWIKRMEAVYFIPVNMNCK